MTSPSNDTPETPSFLTPEIAVIVAIVCSIIAIVAAIMLYQLTVPIFRTGFLGMGLLSAWLIPLICGFIALDETRPPRTKSWQKFSNVYLSTVAAALLVRNIDAVGEYADTVVVVVGFGSPIMLALLAISAILRHTS